MSTHRRFGTPLAAAVILAVASGLASADDEFTLKVPLSFSNLMPEVDNVEVRCAISDIHQQPEVRSYEQLLGHTAIRVPVPPTGNLSTTATVKVTFGENRLHNGSVSPLQYANGKSPADAKTWGCKSRPCSVNGCWEFHPSSQQEWAKPKAGTNAVDAVHGAIPG